MFQNVQNFNQTKINYSISMDKFITFSIYTLEGTFQGLINTFKKDAEYKRTSNVKNMGKHRKIRTKQKQINDEIKLFKINFWHQNRCKEEYNRNQ